MKIKTALKAGNPNCESYLQSLCNCGMNDAEFIFKYPATLELCDRYLNSAWSN